MKIMDLTVNRRYIKLHKPFKTALRTVTEIESIDVFVHTDEGVVGKGAATATPVITGDFANGIEEAILGPIRSALIGKDLLQLQTLLLHIQLSCVGNTSAKAAVDMALYDTYCQFHNMPLYALLGGKKDIRTDITVSVDEPSVMAKEAKSHVEKGFLTLKIKVGKTATLDLERIEAIKSSIPKDITLRLDANQGWSPKEAVAIIQEMERRNLAIEFVEQPVHAKDWEGMKYVKNHVQTPIMADESVFSAQDALKLVQGNYADLLNIKLMKCGGIREAWKIADIAEAAGVKCMVGSMMESSLSVTAIAHVAAAHPNIHYFDLDAPLWLMEEPTGMTFSGPMVNLHHAVNIK
ncbi:dipeptide epimerase [Bacillus sp. DX1.1]|uniref:dipeptide epimerase n=1 Tax=unclassified Bacillus (in: firmicutes) TaxID=185979 RepID=UPI00257070CC|nr:MULTISPECIES: dipeptide epimerase [unclassified Bacillus (in: firmicutes)]MDM5155204.1 dipeptide epimerase [Bacillus sp. DX1.1]WJE79525.1 dipeptide epimerase [Bacillus sp. DX3.1]